MPLVFFGDDPLRGFETVLLAPGGEDGFGEEVAVVPPGDLLRGGDRGKGILAALLVAGLFQVERAEIRQGAVGGGRVPLGSRFNEESGHFVAAFSTFGRIESGKGEVGECGTSHERSKVRKNEGGFH